MNKGQVTAFIILGIVLLVLVGVGIYVMREPAEEIQEGITLSQEAQVVSKFVDSCIDSSVNTGLVYIGLQGGYSRFPILSISTIYSDVPYYYYKGVNDVITKEELESQFAEYVAENVKTCVADFATLEGNYEIEDGVLSAVVEVDDITGLAVSLDYPVEIKSGNRIEKIDRFSRNYNIRLGTILDVSGRIVERVAQDPRVVPISYLVDLNLENDLQIDALTYGNDTVVYLIQDNNSIASGLPLLFTFATKMDVDAHLPVLNSATLNAKCGEEFNYFIEAFDPDGDVLSAADDSELFDIHPVLGEISFTPFQGETCIPGSYPFTITIFDGTNMVSEEFSLTISN